MWHELALPRVTQHYLEWIGKGKGSSRPLLNPDFFSTKRLLVGVSLIPPGWDTSPLQVYPQLFCQDYLTVSQYPFIHLDRERQMNVELSFFPEVTTRYNAETKPPTNDPSILWSSDWKSYMMTSTLLHLQTFSESTENLKSNGHLESPLCFTFVVDCGVTDTLNSSFACKEIINSWLKSSF